MHQLRGRWIALLGGALLVALSVATVFGADPADASDDPRGRSIAAFVHSLVFSEDEAPSEQNLDEEPTDNDALLGNEVAGANAGAHGACVSEVARDKDAVGGPNDNHGGAVSEAARETCREEADEGAAEVESAEATGGGNGKGRGNGRGGRP